MGEHIPTIQGHGPQWQWSTNFPRAMRAAIDFAGNGGFTDFIWSADDIYPLRAMQLTDVGDVPMYCRLRDLDLYLARAKHLGTQGYTRSFYDGIRQQRDILRTLGYDTQHNADMHMPHQLNAASLGVLMDTFADKFPDHPAGHFRAVYGGLFPGKVTRVADPKTGPMTRPTSALGWVSTSGTSWKGTPGEVIRSLFTEPSEYERRVKP